MSAHKGGTNTTKDVIYIDVDDEITGIIDKVQGSDKKIVALVLPKRAAVLQSIVNMKLLKRATGDAKKNLVLITSETSLMPLAGSVKIHVAKSLNSKPEVPDAPENPDNNDVVDVSDDTEDAAIDANKSVGELSGVPASADHVDESIELDDEEEASSDKPSKGGKLARIKQFKIPNFNKFRVLLALGAVGVLLLGGVGYAALAVWPEAEVTIKTNSEAVNSSLVLTLKTGADVKLDTAQSIVKAELQEVKKTLTQEAPATGQLNKGEKATGSVDMTAQDCSAPYSVAAVAAGTGLTTSGGKTYIIGEKASFSPTTFNFSTSCWNYKADGIDITAQTGGASSDTGSTSFTVAGRSDVTATGSASGGTDNIVKVVSQADIDGAKIKITEQDTKPIQQELQSALIGRGLFALDTTLAVGTPETKLSAEANTEAEVVTVTQTITYTMLGVKQEDLEKIIASDVEKKIDTKKQSIVSYGLDDAFFSLQGVNPDGAVVGIQTTAVTGAELNADTLKKQIAGKKAGDAKELILANPSVTEVNVEYSPFWVSSIPKKMDKIRIIIQEPKVTADDEQQSP